MFYQDIPKEEINDSSIDELYKKIEPMLGQLVIVNGAEVMRFIGLLRDDSFDGEWCYRLVTFPSRETKCGDHSIIACHMVKLQGVIDPDDYERIERMWRINAEIFPQKDYTTYEKEKNYNHPWSLHYGKQPDK
jgi:hypothetical protein